MRGFREIRIAGHPERARALAADLPFPAIVADSYEAARRDADVVCGASFDTELTLYKSVGVAVQDGAAAALLLEAARRTGHGQQVTL